jgi:hypothetical protein
MSNRIIGAVAFLVLLAGLVVLLAGHGIVALVVGGVLVGLSGIALVSLAFLLVGEGEELDRRRHPRG